MALIASYLVPDDTGESLTDFQQLQLTVFPISVGTVMFRNLGIFLQQMWSTVYI